MAAVKNAPEKPVLFILNLDKGQTYENMFDGIYSDLINSLCSRYRVQRARAVDPAKRYLSNSANRPSAILVTDPTIAQKGQKPVLDQVIGYVKAGGMAILAANFSSFITLPEMDDFWTTWGLAWKKGDYHRTDVFLNRNTSNLATSSLPKSYSQKAVFIQHVSSSDSVYSASPESRTQSHVFPAEPVDQDQTPVAFTKIGEGWLGYIGDVNNEDESQAVIMAMIDFAVDRSKQTSQ